MSSDSEATKPMQMVPDPAHRGAATRDEPVELDDRPFANDVERYQPLGTLGKGGMGEILLVKDTRIARQVAIKVLQPKLRDKREYRSRFLIEARLQGQLEHPSIVPVHDLGEREGGELYFSMKCVRGVTLQEALRAVREAEQTTRFSRRRLLTAFSSVCLAVDFAHSRGVVHRDLKPPNIMLGDFGEVYVLDWGIAKLVDSPDTPIEHALEIPHRDDAATRADKVLGTPHYMAPERLARGIADARTDVFALGVILRELLDADAGDIPPELAEVVTDATATDPARRIGTARELHDLVEKYLDGDRDLELRRTQSEEHARLAEAALARSDANARTEAGRAIGRALGLDPSNERAMHTLMRLLTEVPAQLPPAAQVEFERAWHARRTRTLRVSSLFAVAVLGYTPFLLWMGVRSWALFAAWFVLSAGAAIAQLIAARSERTLTLVVALVCALGGAFLLTSSMGLLGYLPAALSLLGVAWRVMLRRWYHGALLIVGLSITISAPFLLAALGVMPPAYAIQDDVIVVHAHLHHFPTIPTTVSLLMATMGAVAGAVLFARVYATEIRRAEERLTFHAWQLQQLLTPQS